MFSPVYMLEVGKKEEGIDSLDYVSRKIGPVELAVLVLDGIFDITRHCHYIRGSSRYML